MTNKEYKKETRYFWLVKMRIKTTKGVNNYEINQNRNL